MFKNNYLIISLIFLLINFNSALASLKDDSDTIFNWAELQYPEYFSPTEQPSQTLDVWYYRHYPVTGIYVGVNNLKQVYVMGGHLVILPF